MQSAASDGRNSTAAHNLGRQVAQTAGQIIIDDVRLRSFVLSQSGGIAQLASPAWCSASAVSGTGLTVNTWYYYQVCSLSSNNQSTGSPVASAFPTSVSARVGVTWSSVPAATAYRIYRSLTGNSFES